MILVLYVQIVDHVMQVKKLIKTKDKWELHNMIHDVRDPYPISGN